MAVSKGAKAQTTVATDTDVAERIASALELMVEKLGNIETKLEELTYELQAHANVLADAVGMGEEEMEMGGCGTGCGASEGGCGASESAFIQIEK